MEMRKALDGRAAGLMVVLCLVWGLQQVAIKAAAPDIAPLLQIALRSGVAAALVGLLMLVRRERLSLAGTWRPGLLVGFLFALEYLLVGEGLRYTSASHMVVFLYTAPIFAALGLQWRLPSERLVPLQWMGILLAFAGIALAFFGGDHGGGFSGDVFFGDLLGLLGGVAWGATTVVIRCSRLAGTPAALTLFYQLAAAFLLLTPAAVALGQWGFDPTPLAWSSLAFQAVVVSFVSFLAWFWLLRHYLASRLGVFSFLTPLFGVVLGAWLLDEAIERGFLMGAVFVLFGILLVSGHGWLKALLRGRRAA